MDDIEAQKLKEDLSAWRQPNSDFLLSKIKPLGRINYISPDAEIVLIKRYGLGELLTAERLRAAIDDGLVQIVYLNSKGTSITLPTLL